MNLLPFDRTELRSTSTPDEIAARVAELVTQGHWAAQRPFRGKLQGRRFQLVRNVQRPHAVVVGEIESAGAGSVVRLRFRLRWALAAFLGVWFALFSYAAAANLRGLASDVAGIVLALVAGTVTVGFAAALLTTPFRHDVRQALETLRAAVERA
ncbi:hypothetical protein A2cp1_0386 [Anaeromyxobacter dehalogenans 2CP-1]|uniref:Uncharacterized protein n=1 Tax=Anaeromyxobacter dehalogenans (strain ATCC BAA-258 / DSM 21875 / 2CP-1) TaxID=455488 RepID=B8JA40_ANAD2|nr:hypothetical protein [Anaeromyxobacter dehalogenans]ACL63743.1 hypothetical protein A2cp1_0386 [Anaeromyxobacter dehalogenans 2CP-1]